MSTLVLKFGGTSVASTELIKSAAKIVKKEYENGHNIAAVSYTHLTLPTKA